MLLARITRSNVSRVTVLINTHLNSMCNKPNPCHDPINNATLTNCLDSSFKYVFSSFSTSRIEHLTVQTISESIEDVRHSREGDDDNNDESDNSDSEENEVKDVGVLCDEGLVNDVKVIVDILRDFHMDCAKTKSKLENCGVKASSELVVEVLSRVRNDWEAAFTFFLWAGNQEDYAHSVREYHSMISILGKMRKFDTAWALIDEMRRGWNGRSLLTPHALLILIRRYCAVHDVGRAINTFYAYKRFNFDVGVEEFQSLLSALCRYKNVQDAEQLMFCNKDVFPFDTKSFNIILNGWCNVICSKREAERVWNEMGRRRIQYDAVSYGSIMSCYSKANNLYKVLRLFDHMKKMGIDPDRKVYNAVIHALAKGKMLKDAINLMKTMEEKGITPNVVTYNSLIKPLCKAHKIDEAKWAFDEMLQRGLSPTIQTYHAFFRFFRTGEEVFELLGKMREIGCQPTNDTYIMLIRKFCRWRHFDNVFKIWDEMSENVGHDLSSYIVLIHGLFLNGKVEEAHKYYVEMKEKQFLPDPKTDEMLKTWFSSKQFLDCRMAELKDNQLDCGQSTKQTKAISRKLNHNQDFLQKPEIRRVVRERGFSFWEE